MISVPAQGESIDWHVSLSGRSALESAGDRAATATRSSHSCTLPRAEPWEVFMRKLTRQLRLYGTSGLLLLVSALPAQATDVVPFVGLRFGGDVGTQPGNGVTGPTSVTIDSSVSYGGVIDIPLTQPRSLELYYSRQPTKLSGDSTVGDVTMNVLHIGLVDTLPSSDQQLSWLLVGTVGATQLSARDGSETRPSVGLGGGFE